MSGTTHCYRVCSFLAVYQLSYSGLTDTQCHSSVFLNTALIQWAFRVSPDPKAPIDQLAFTESANTHPMPFKVNFEPRFTTKEGVKEFFEAYGL